VPGADPLVDRQHAVGIVHLEILVVQVVRKGMGIDQPFLSGLDLVEPDMADHGAGACHLKMVEHQQRMRRYDQVQQNVGPVEKVFDRVHRERGPRAWID